MHPFWRHADYVSLTMEFRCNLACTHCMIEGTMDRLRPVDLAQFERVLAAREAHGWTGLILTGSEITLLKDLPRLAERARRAGFRHVRVQTHGMHLDHPGYLRRLVEAGVDEFFVSVAAATAETHDRITQVPGSFDRTLAGLEAVEQHDAISITNTVLTSESLAIVVEDEGAGLGAEDLAPGCARAAEHTRGLSFGLAVARSLLEAHGGELRLEAQAGIGARAWLVLPRSRMLAG